MTKSLFRILLRAIQNMIKIIVTIMERVITTKTVFDFSHSRPKVKSSWWLITDRGIDDNFNELLQLHCLKLTFHEVL